MRTFQIGNRTINEDSAPYIIAEIGNNHEGYITTAMDMIGSAKHAGADAVKFQKRDLENLYTTAFGNQPYNSPHSHGRTYLDHRRSLELSANDFRRAQAFAEQTGITFFASAFDFASVDLLVSMRVPVIKIASGDLTNIPLIKYASQTGTPLIISTGGGSLPDCQRAARACYSPFALLHCHMTYPTVARELNLCSITTLLQEFPDTIIGLSDHFPDLYPCYAAYALGARIFEKHFTLDRAAKGGDHSFSLTPHQLALLCENMKKLSISMGYPAVYSSCSEAAALYKMGKSLYYTKDLPVKHIISIDDIAIKSPKAEEGLLPYALDEILGRPLLVPVHAETPVQRQHYTRYIFDKPHV